MESKLNSIEKKVDKLDERLDTINETIIKQHYTLEDHVRRSLANENALNILKDELKPVFTYHIIIVFLGKITLLALTSGLIWKLVLYFINSSF